jgi:hypothetical protein
VPLSAGWNLISFQVNSNGFSPQDMMQALGSDAGALLGIWGYDPGSHIWQVYQPSNALPSAAVTLQRLYPGKGYWIKSTRSTTLQLTGSPWNGVTMLLPGWNLVGFPGVTVGPAGKTDFASIFRGQLSSVPVIWTFQGGAMQRFVGYDTLALPPITDLTGVQPGQGYWVFSTASVSLTPTPVIALPPDSTAPRGPHDSPLPTPQVFLYGNTNYTGPLSRTNLYVNQLVRFADTNDAPYDLDHNGVLDSPYTQDTMFFGQGVNQENISLFNTGSGLMNWYIASGAPWLTITPPSGATSTEQDSVQISVNRAGLQPGFYTNTFTIYAASTVQMVTVILQVPTIAGDWRGVAGTQRVNGKNIAIGAVDLSVSLFNETSDPSDPHFRGVISSDQSLLFPNDVFMNGIFYQGLNFSLTTSFPMAPADRDAPPYTSFPTPNATNTMTPVVKQTQYVLPSVDVNQNGLLDVNNIFPFGIRREITLLGSLTTSDHAEGTYVEAISGPLPGGQRIYIEGTFVLDRQTLSPTVRSIYNVQTNTTVIIGGSVGGHYTTSICVGSDVRIQGATVNMNFNFPDPSQLDVVLYAPGHTNFYDFGTNVAGLTSFTLTNFDNTSGLGCWELVINWNTNSGLRGYFNGWGLNLGGLAYYSVAGTVVDNATNGVAGATVALVGGNLLPQTYSAADGSFSFAGLTENEYVLNVSKLGYAPASVGFNIDATNLNVGNIILAPLSTATPYLSAQPGLGQAPLNVSFVPIISPAALTGLGSNLVAIWSFGDGSPLVTTQAGTFSYVYTNPGSFQPSVTLAGSAGTNVLTAGFVTALAAFVNTNLLNDTNFFVFGGGFIGSIASLTPTDGGAGSDILVSPTTNTPSSFAVYQESKRDSATFHFRRDPYGQFSGALPGPQDTVFFVQTNTPYYSVSGGNPIVGTNQLYRIISTLGGYVFPSEAVPWTDNSARQGDFVLQSGRVED